MVVLIAPLQASGSLRTKAAQSLSPQQVSLPLLRQGFNCGGPSRGSDGRRFWLCLRSSGSITYHVQIWAADPARVAFVEAGVFAIDADIERAAAELFGSLTALIPADSEAKSGHRRLLASGLHTGTVASGERRLTLRARPYARFLRIEFA